MPESSRQSAAQKAKKGKMPESGRQSADRKVDKNTMAESSHQTVAKEAMKNTMPETVQIAVPKVDKNTMAESSHQTAAKEATKNTMPGSTVQIAVPKADKNTIPESKHHIAVRRVKKTEEPELKLPANAKTADKNNMSESNSQVGAQKAKKNEAPESSFRPAAPKADKGKIPELKYQTATQQSKQTTVNDKGALEPSIKAITQKIQTPAIEQREGFFLGIDKPTQKECDDMAKRILRQEAAVVSSQGKSSYTVLGGERVVQFRHKKNKLDAALIMCAEKVHGKLMPKAVDHNELDGLHVYTMTRMTGNALPTVAEDQVEMHEVVQDYARFCAAWWTKRPKTLPAPRAGLQQEYEEALDKMMTILPPRFHDRLMDMRSRIGGLFKDDWPMAVSNPHLDKSDMFVDPHSGGLGCVGHWSRAEVTPFGMSLASLEKLLGDMKSDPPRWEPLTDHALLRVSFLGTFRQAIGGHAQWDARMGLAGALGTLLDKNGLGKIWRYRKHVLPDESPEVQYLDAAFLKRIKGDEVGGKKGADGKAINAQLLSFLKK